MKSFAEQIAQDMNQIIDSDSHKSIFSRPSLGKFAAKKDDEDKEDEDDKDDKKEDKEKKSEKDEKKDDKKSDKDKKDKKDDDKDEDKDDKKKESLHSLVDSISKISSTLDDLGLIKSSLYTINAIKHIVAEAGCDSDHDKGDDMDYASDSQYGDTSYDDDNGDFPNPVPTSEIDKQLEELDKIPEKKDQGKADDESDFPKPVPTSEIDKELAELDKIPEKKDQGKADDVFVMELSEEDAELLKELGLE